MAKDKEKLTPEKHKKVHKELHKAMDMVIASFLMHNKNRHLTSTTLMELMTWSHQETINPTPK